MVGIFMLLWIESKLIDLFEITNFYILMHGAQAKKVLCDIFVVPCVGFVPGGTE
jgi:hypothetical protein